MLRAVPVTVSVAFILRENIAYDYLTRLSVSSSYQQPSIVSSHTRTPKGTELALDFVVMRPNEQTACGVLARVTIDKPTIRKSIPINGLRHHKRISRTKPINSTSWTYLLQVHGIVLPDRDVRTNTRGLATCGLKRSRRTIT